MLLPCRFCHDCSPNSEGSLVLILIETVETYQDNSPQTGKPVFPKSQEAVEVLPAGSDSDLSNSCQHTEVTVPCGASMVSGSVGPTILGVGNWKNLTPVNSDCIHTEASLSLLFCRPVTILLSPLYSQKIHKKEDTEQCIICGKRPLILSPQVVIPAHTLPMVVTSSGSEPKLPEACRSSDWSNIMNTIE